MKKKKENKKEKELNLSAIEIGTRKFLYGPLWRKYEKQQRLFRPYYISR